MSGRKAIPEATQQSILTKSRRRCCLCFWLDHVDETSSGQLAHLDRNHENPTEDNLTFLCLKHHDEYDGKTSQSKGFQEKEVRHWRDELYREMNQRTAAFMPSSSNATGHNISGNSGQIVVGDGNVITVNPAPAHRQDNVQSFTDYERNLLLAASFDNRTNVSYFEATGGYTIHAGGRLLFGGADLRELEGWMSAIGRLTALQCLRQQSSEDWNLTPKGYNLSDSMRFAEFDDAIVLSKLSSEARRLLLDAAAGGEIIVMDGLSESSVTINGRELLSLSVTLGDVMESLVTMERCGLLRQDTRDFYGVTKKGRKVAESLKLGEI